MREEASTRTLETYQDPTETDRGRRLSHQQMNRTIFPLAQADGRSIISSTEGTAPRQSVDDNLVTLLMAADRHNSHLIAVDYSRLKSFMRCLICRAFSLVHWQHVNHDSQTRKARGRGRSESR